MSFKRRSLPEPTVNMSIIQSFAHLKTISCRVPNFDGSKEICNVPPEFALRFMGLVFAIQKLFIPGLQDKTDAEGFAGRIRVTKVFGVENLPLIYRRQTTAAGLI
jgi:hypothetical protein